MSRERKSTMVELVTELESYLCSLGLPEKRIAKFISNLTQKPSGCIEWAGHRHAQGYGVFSINAKQVFTHRIVAAASLEKSPKPFVCHTCDNPPCVNPDHLFWGTAQDNALDMRRKGRGHRIYGERNPQNRLSPNDVQAIRLLVKNGFSMKTISSAFKKVSWSTIYHIKNGVTWGFLPYRSPMSEAAMIRLKKYMKTRTSAAGL